MEEAAVREAMKETGLHIRITGIVALNEYRIKDTSEHGVCVTFKSCIIDGVETITRPEEIKNISWIRVEQADALMPFYKEGLKEIVRKNVQVTYFDEGSF
ncbi:NUDIX hydrolase [Brevibacillus fluminis]|uniref:NUDIX hydrolase n=1 Tax=Brevibacillus fluminis TaxID=511487 RepID=UPI001FEA31A2|nr:NUDIX hydrolase [Brevibacillus fluminis]